MAKRYYLCEMVKDAEGSDVPAVDEYGVPYVSAGRDDESKNFMLVLVATKNHGRLIADPRVRVLPDFPLDAKMNDLNQVAQTSLNNALTRFGISLSVSQADGYRNVIRNIGRQLNSNFDENNFDVSE